jgi:hypothetical protein
MSYPPGDFKLTCTYTGMISVAPQHNGDFEIEVNAVSRAVLNRSELAALHAAIGEFLDFYRNYKSP